MHPINPNHNIYTKPNPINPNHKITKLALGITNSNQKTESHQPLSLKLHEQTPK